MKNPSRKAFDVYEFNDEEEESELVSNKLLERFSRFSKKHLQELQKPKFDTSPLRKYQLLKTFSSRVTPQGKKMNYISCIDVETSESNHKCKDHGTNVLGTFDGGDCTVKEGTSGSDEIPVSNSISHEDHGTNTPGTFDGGDCTVNEGTSESDELPVSNSISHEENAHTNPDSVKNGNLFPGCLSFSSLSTSRGNENQSAMGASTLGVPSSGNGKINGELSELPSSNNSLDVVSDDNGSAASSSAIREDQGSLEGSESIHYSDGWEMDNIHMAVVVSPDYLIYKDLYSTDSRLSFSSSCIKFEGVNAYGSKEVFSFEWETVDVVGIESQWYSKVETALVKLCLRPTADLEAEITDGIIGIVELKFAVCDPHWFERQEEIMSMDAKYKAIWMVSHDEEDTFLGKNRICHLKRHYPIFNEPFEDVIYPKGDPDAVSLGKRDVELLEPETFINDTIIDFYIMYLKKKIRPEYRSRFHFFNSFFFRKLADLDKNPSSASDGRAAFLRVRKWTRKVNLFEKDYVFIPINFNLHWSLIVICHPGEATTFKDEDIDKSLKVPCILHMDSIKGSHKGLKSLVQSYLREEWKERQPEPSEDVSSNFLNLRFVPLELPQQENSFDCGLFLLHYVEQFLEEAPVYFNPFKLTKSSNFLNLDWFPPAEASLKRAFIQNLIYKLCQDPSQEIPAGACDNEYQSLLFMENNSEKENGLEFLSEGQTAATSCNGFSSCSNDDQGIEIKLLGTHGSSAQFVGDSGFVLKELFEPGTTAGSFPNAKFRSFDQEDEDGGEQFAFSPSGGTDCQQMDGYTVGGACTTSYTFKGFGIYDTFPNSGISMRRNEDDHNDHLSAEAFSCGSQSSSEVMVDDNLPVRGSWCPNRQETENSRSISLENNICTAESSGSGCSEGLDTRMVDDSQEVDRVADDDEKKQEKFSASSDHCETHLGKNENRLGENLELSDDIIASESVEQRAAKRARLTLPPEDEMRLTGSLANDWEV